MNDNTHTTVFNHPSELNSLSAFSILRKRGLGRLQLGESFSHPNKEQLEEKLNKFHYACGCSASAKMLLFGLFSGILNTTIFNFGQLPNNWFFTIVELLSAGLFGGIAGKVYGLVKANIRLKATVSTIQKEWKPDVKQEKEPIICG